MGLPRPGPGCFTVCTLPFTGLVEAGDKNIAAWTC